MNKNRLSIGSSSLLLATVIAMPAMSQTTNASDGGLQLEEIVVTAEKREVNLQKTAISIQVTSGEQLRQEGKRRIDEIMRDTAGVEFQTNNFGANVFMRGLGNTEGIPGGGEKAVATIIDGAYQYRTEVLSNGTLDVKQVEVMRGAQSTTLGAGSLAGAVSLVSNKPIFEYQASGSLEGANYNTVNAEGVINLPLTSNQAIRAAYSTAKRDGYVSSGAGGTDNTNARLKYRWQAGDTLDMVLTYNFQKSFVIGRSDTVATDGYYRFKQAGDTCVPPYNNSIDRCPYGSGDTGATIVHVANGVNFRDRADAWNDGFPLFGWPNTVYRYNKINTGSAELNWSTAIGTVTLTPQVQTVRNISQEAPMGTSYLHEDESEKSRQVEARLASSAGGPLQWLGGAYYYYRDTPSTNAYNLDIVTGLYTPGGMGVVTKNSAETNSVYANATYSIIDSLRVLGGARYSKDSKDNVTVGSTELKHDWKKATYRVGLEYDFRQDSMLYATYQTGYQPGSVDSMSSCNGQTGFTCEQTTEQFTLGIKNQFFDQKLQVNVEAFDTKYHNRPFQGTLSASQTSNGVDGTGTVAQSYCNPSGPPNPNAPAFYRDLSLSCVRYNTSVTVPDWKSRGVDIDLSWLPTANDRVDLTAEYLQSKQGALPVSFSAQDIYAGSAAAGSGESSAGTLADAQALANILNAQVAAYNGLTPQNSPKWTVNGTYQHRFGLPGGSSFTPKVTGIYKTKYWSQGGGPGANIVAPGAAYQQAYTKWEAYGTWASQSGRWTLTGYMKNVTNEVIQINYGTQDVQLDAPRTFGVILNANF